MPPLFDLKMMAPDRIVIETSAQGLIAPGVEGYLGVLAHHAPMLAELGPGVVTVIDGDGQRRHFALSSGFLEVRQDGVTLLADAAEAAAEVNADRARAAEGRARRRLQAPPPEIDVVRAEAALRRALARLAAVEKSHTTG